jgi:hypothetical protein
MWCCFNCVFYNIVMLIWFTSIINTVLKLVLAIWLGYTKATRVKRLCHANKTQMSSFCKAKTINKLLLDKNFKNVLDKYIFYWTNIFFTGQTGLLYWTKNTGHILIIYWTKRQKLLDAKSAPFFISFIFIKILDVTQFTLIVW